MSEKIWDVIQAYAKHYVRVCRMKSIEEFVASLDEAGRRFFDRAVDENLADRWPAGFLRRENVGGPGAMYQGPFCSYREVRPNGAFFLACLGAFGVEEAEKAWAEHAQVLINPPKVYEEHIVAGVPFEALDFSDCDERYAEKNRVWAQGFIERRDTGRLAEVHYFREDSDWYSLIGYQEEDGRWSVIPTPIFWSLWPKTIVPIDKMSYDAEPLILEAFKQITLSERSIYEEEQASTEDEHGPVRPADAPETVAGLPLSKIANSANQCESTPVQYCADYVEHRYISPSKTDPWGFRVASVKLTSGDKAAVKAAYIARAKAVEVGEETVYLFSNGISWFTSAKTADMVFIVLMPIDSRSGTVGFGEITPSDVRSNSAFIATFLASFPPQK